MSYAARVDVMLKPGISDPQGQTIERALPVLGYTGVTAVRVGKRIELEVDAASPEEARSKVEQMCERLLANPVIESYEVTLAVTMRVAIVVFPGSNCELDARDAFRGLGAETIMVWHAEASLPATDLVVLPGGFAHGDYLRTGALARFSPIMGSVRRHAQTGGLVLGICNGFQILCEAGMLPGALRKNSGLKFLCKWVTLRVDDDATAFTTRADLGQELRIPINHFEGNWYVEPHELERLKATGQIVLRYVDNPNGSLDDVAGVRNEAGNVFGLMPHPERACELLLGSVDGEFLLGSLLDHAETAAKARV